MCVFVGGTFRFPILQSPPFSLRCFRSTSREGDTGMSERITRSNFLKTTSTAAAAAGYGIVLHGCSAGKKYDLVVKDGLVFDGLGRPGRTADLGLIDGRIESIGSIPASRGRDVIEAKGLAVAPGFIDVHQHTDVELLVNPKAESAVRQGVTTVISGNCGSSPAPIAAEVLEENQKLLRDQYGLELTWRDFGEFFRRLEAAGISVNYGTLVGHGAVRGAAMGFSNRAAKPEELDQMKAFVASALDDGVLGFSTGLEYTPGSFAPADELTALCRIVAGRGGVYATHMRDEGGAFLEALDESVKTAVAAGVSLQISHLKTAYAANWDKIDVALAKIDAARAAGLDILCDRYPYTAAATSLSYNFPVWAREGTAEEVLARLKDPFQDLRLRAAIAERERKLGSFDRVLISDVLTEKNKIYEGKNVLEGARMAGKKPYEFIRDLVIEERDNVGMVFFIMNEANLKKFLAHPLVGIGSDASALSPVGPLGKGKPHPRTYGTFPRTLGKYVREEKVVPLAEMIRKMTSLPARKFGLTGRGIIEQGASADIVVFNPDTVADRATWSDPHQYPVGIEAVVVNGDLIVDHGTHTGKPAGRILRRIPKP
jgi:N-acyl-D-amino-acid deacylase